MINGDPSEDGSAIHLGSFSNIQPDYASSSSYGTMQVSKPAPEASGNQLGTINGVFIPAMLGILGVVTFLRMGWVVGQAGLVNAYVILFLGNCCTILTSASLSAIATNGRIKGGGAYYMISRSLGPEFGGSIGLIFFLANVVGSGVYIKGFVEATQSVVELWWPDWYATVSSTENYWLGFGLGSVVLLFLTITCLFGASFFIKFLVLIYVVEIFSLLFSMVSFAFQSPSGSGVEGYTGWNTTTFTENLKPHYQAVDGEEQSFQTVFAVFFPAMAGIMGGANMSGDLKDPSRSIPPGTITAIIVAFVLYFIEMFIIAFTTSYTALYNYDIMQEVAFFDPIITMGVYCAALSSTISGMTGGSRVFQALARDRIIPAIGFFGRGFGKGDEPLYALTLTWLLVQLLMFLPNLNTLATVSSLFFLFSYSLTNLACFALEVAGAPNFRPTFKYFTWYSSLAGTLLCLISCFIVSYELAILSFICISALFLYIYFQAPQQEWGDVKQAIIFHQVRKFLLRLDVRKSHAKNWRPSILLLIEHPQSAQSLIEFVNSIKKGGMYILGTVLVSSECGGGQVRAMKRLKQEYVEFIHRTKIKAFDELVISPSLLLGIRGLLQTAGVGVLKPNTVAIGFPSSIQTAEEIAAIREEAAADLLGHPEQEDNVASTNYLISAEEYVNCINEALLFDKNVLITRNFDGFSARSISGGKKGRWSRKFSGLRRKKIGLF